jgi:hypothetical protein
VRIKLINYPCYVPPSEYEGTIQQLIEIINKAGVVSIFQIGHVKTPGISDIDILVVFEEGVKYNFDPLEYLPKRSRYLFTHSLFGISRRHFYEAQRFTFYHNYRLLWGEDLNMCRTDLSPQEIDVLKRQTALEFLIANFISKTIELTYRMVSLRNLLLSVNTLRYDMEFLNISSGRLLQLIMTLIDWRHTWFHKKVEEEALQAWIQEFYAELQAFLAALLKRQKFYLPLRPQYQMARHIRLAPGSEFCFKHDGISLPSVFFRLGKKAVRLLHRFNQFDFTIPITSCSEVEILNHRFKFLNSLKLDHANYKGFAPLMNNVIYKVA